MANEIMDPAKIAEFRSYSDGNDDFIKELFAQYEESSNSLLEKIKNSYGQDNVTQLLSDIHALKGSTRNMGLLELGNFIIDWEKRVKETGPKDFDSDYRKLQDLYNKVLEFRKENFPA